MRSGVLGYGEIQSTLAKVRALFNQDFSALNSSSKCCIVYSIFFALWVDSIPGDLAWPRLFKKRITLYPTDKSVSSR